MNDLPKIPLPFEFTRNVNPLSGAKEGSLDWGHKKAQKMYEVKECVVCGAIKSLNRHHRDLNPLNNSPENVITLCSRCHILIHQEMGTRHAVKDAKCVICGKTFHPKCTERSKICSSECLSVSRKNSANRLWAGHKTTKICAYCGKEFVFKRAREKTCSRSCGAKLGHGVYGEK